MTSIVLATVPQSEPHTTATRAVLDDWQARLLAQAARFGVALGPADADRLLILVEGAWIVGRIRQSRQPLVMAGEVFLASL